jgi:hypothetical protein
MWHKLIISLGASDDLAFSDIVPLTLTQFQGDYRLIKRDWTIIENSDRKLIAHNIQPNYGWATILVYYYRDA